MTTYFMPVALLITALAWLLLLVATSFSILAVGAGLLGALWLNGALSRRTHGVN